MSLRVDPTLLPELHKYGAFDIDACFNCGNYIEICPLATSAESMLRRLIRLGQIGLKEPH